MPSTWPAGVQSVVVNDIGCTMGGDGADARVADEVVDEIRRAGGIAVASYDSVDTPEGGAGDRADGDRPIRPARRRGEQRRHLPDACRSRI